MECRTLEITVISAQDIKDVNLFSKMDVYAVVMIAGDESSKKKTPIHKHGGTSPQWNHHMKFPINEELARQNRPTLHFLLKSERSFGDKDIGEVYVPIQELDGNGYGKSGREVSFGVRKPSGRDKGVLTFSYKFGQRFVVETIKEPVMMAYPAAGKAGTGLAYAAPAPPPEGYYAPPPAHPPAHAAGYPPPPVAGCGYPPAAPGYGYPPSQAAYGYGYLPPPVQKPHKKKKNKLGFGSGLLGGLLIGDMLSDVGDACAYDAGYCDGIDDAGDFDF
ncbi:hypothetical protein L1049_020348 [Liquidambar formosana]|uniref:C2 domain-containing protein n=1 Tax=Liquidambar formosana TaxID=63359 RepID=A0AAP0SCZ8_LIQFO